MIRAHALRAVAMLVLTAGVTGARPAAAEFPEKPIRMVVPAGAGGGADTSARLFAAEMGKLFKQSVYVENVPGAGGSIGTDRVTKATADGYTILFGFNALVTLLPALNPKMPYKASDLQPLGITSFSCYVLLASSELPAKNMPELVALAKAQPGRIAYASTGNGSAAHLGGELLQQQAGIQLLHVPFKSPGLVELMANQVQLKLEPLQSGVPLLKQGKLKALGVSCPERVKSLPDVPAIAETLPGYEVVGWQGVWAPKGTPLGVVSRLNGALATVLKLPEVQTRQADSDTRASDPSIDTMARAIDSEAVLWARLVRERGIKPE